MDHRAMAHSWPTARDTEPVTAEPTDGGPVRSILNIWRRGPDGLWRSERRPIGHGVPFTALVTTLSLRHITEDEARACTTS